MQLHDKKSSSVVKISPHSLSSKYFCPLQETECVQNVANFTNFHFKPNIHAISTVNSIDIYSLCMMLYTPVQPSFTLQMMNSSNLSTEPCFFRHTLSHCFHLCRETIIFQILKLKSQNVIF